jgi:TPR repeat protein
MTSTTSKRRRSIARRCSPAHLGLLCATLFSATSYAGPLQDAQAAYDRGKYGIALDLWQPLAERGNPDAQVGLGGLYLGGYGVAKDEAAAMAWFRKAAEQGSAAGQFSLASLFFARKDYAASVAWFRRSAEQGNALAQLRLARLYNEGLGVPRDDVQAFKWFAIAAEGGSDGYVRTNAAQGRDATARKLAADQIAKAQRLAREWKPKSER